MATQRGPFKAAFRNDRAGDAVCVYLLPSNQGEPGPNDPPIATVHRNAMANSPGAFEALQEFARCVVAALTEECTGQKPVEFFIETPSERN